MNEQALQQFDPKEAELQELIAQTKDITTLDINNEDEMESFRTKQRILQKARTNLTAVGKRLRDESNAFSKMVIAREKELVGIITPEEERLKAIEEEARHAFEMETRKSLLPFRRKQLAEIGDKVAELSDDEVNAMDANQFEEYRQGRITARNEAAFQELEAKKREEEATRAEIARKIELKNAEERARQEERARIEREAEEAKKREAEEKAKLESKKKYHDFLAKHGWTEATQDNFKIVSIGNKVSLYQLVDTITL